ncbi:MAG: hypothetical protein Edafosvirus4_55 [Edafosvirus sp.]|uniref:Uncharacterized protein n=1 Tax=Edafosvirus sp. TaxID=2487765 RepID=A0A3G4ZVQ0_9VIRU|nr:MAG: hypothetical protein Edafosvirus4_55 [Edafosvirus sp.]
MQSFCCDVKDCEKKPTSFCKRCIPMRILCSEHDIGLHGNGWFSHSRMKIKDKCNFDSCTLPVLFFCKTHHNMSLCKKHNDLVHPTEHKCEITVPKLVTCTTCSVPCPKCNDTFTELSKEEVVYICNKCDGKVGQACTLCNRWGNTYNSQTGVETMCYTCFSTHYIKCSTCKETGKIISKPICSCIQTYATKGCPTCGKFKYEYKWRTEYKTLQIKAK